MDGNQGDRGSGDGVISGARKGKGEFETDVVEEGFSPERVGRLHEVKIPEWYLTENTDVSIYLHKKKKEFSGEKDAG